MDVDALLRQLERDDRLAETIQHRWTEPGRTKRTAPVPDSLEPRLVRALEKHGISELYTHQERAFRELEAGRDVAIVTPTASGKTLCYNLPVLNQILKRPGSRSLYLFPTKALSQDQVAELSDIVECLDEPIKAYTYDGDTRPAIRRRLREGGDIIVTNPYMLHSGILPNHPKWATLFTELDTVVIDEVHHYRGVFGSHLANLIRRLRRIAASYGRKPRFVLCSATIGNPLELCRTLIGEEPVLIDESGAASGERTFLLCNPPVVHPELNIRVPVIEQVRRFIDRILPTGLQFIAFARSRSQVEILLKYVKDSLRRRRLPMDRVMGYRGGYLPRLRRSIEQGLRSGEIQGVIATNALELGIDIGGMDVCLQSGYPGSVASFFQQAGRVGRRGNSSLVIMVGNSSPTNQYLLQHPELLFDAPREDVIIDPDNLVIKVNHLKCSAFEVPFKEGDAFGQDGSGMEIVDYLAEEVGILHPVDGTYYWMADAYPAEGVSLTAADVDNFVVVEAQTKRIMAEVSRPDAIVELYEGAIYGLQGEQYLIERLEYDQRRAYARKIDADYYTQAETDTTLRILHEDQTVESAAARVAVGDVHVTTQATIYKKLRFYTRENIGAGEIPLPAEEMDSTAFWIAFKPGVAEEAALYDGLRAGGLLAFRNLLRATVPLFIRCDPRDIRVASEIRSPLTGDPTVCLFDSVPGGVGLAGRTFRRRYEVYRAMAGMVSECPCQQGCPSCIGLSTDIGPFGKEVASMLARALLRAEAETQSRDDALPRLKGEPGPADPDHPVAPRTAPI